MANIMISLGMLLVSCLAVGMLSHYAVLPTIISPGEFRPVIGLSDNPSVKLEANSIERTFLDTLVVKDVSATLYHHDEQFFIADAIRLNIPLLDVLLPDRAMNEVAIHATNSDLIVSEDVMKVISNPDQSELSDITDIPAIRLTFDGGTVRASLDSMRVQAAVSDATALFGPNLSITSFDIRLPSLETEISSGFLSMRDVSLSLHANSNGKHMVNAFLGSASGTFEQLGTQFSIGMFDGSFEAANLDEIFKGTGSFVTTIQDPKVSLIQGNDTIHVQAGAVAAEASMLDLVPISVSSSIELFSFMTRINKNDEIQIGIPAFRVALLKDMDGFSGSLESMMGIDAYLNTSWIGGTSKSTVQFGISSEFSSAYLDIDTISIAPSEAWISLLPISIPFTSEYIRLDENYFSVTIDQSDGSIHGEFSSSLGLSTSISLLEHVESDIVGQFNFIRDPDSFEATVESKRLELLGIPGLLTFKTSMTLDEKKFQRAFAQVSHDSGLAVSGTYNAGDEQIALSGRLDAFRPFEMSGLLYRFLPDASQFFVDSTVIGGNMAATIATDFRSGRIFAELGVANFNLEKNLINFAATVNTSFDQNRVDVQSATLTTEDIRIVYQGVLDRPSWFPEGNLLMQQPESGETLISADFYHLGDKSYGYMLSSPLLVSTTVGGVVESIGSNTFFSDVMLNVSGQRYPFDMMLNLENVSIDLQGAGISLRAGLSPTLGRIEANLNLDAFQLPALQGALLTGNPLISGAIEGNYQITDNNFFVSTHNLSIQGLSWAGGEQWELDASVDLDKDSLDMSELAYRDSYGSLQGSAYLHFGSFASIFSNDFSSLKFFGLLRDAREDASTIEFSFKGAQDQKESVIGLLEAKRIGLGRFGSALSPYMIDFSTLGSMRTDMRSLDVKAHIQLYDIGRQDLLVSIGSIGLNDLGLSISDIQASIGALEISNGLIDIPTQGIPEARASVFFDMESLWRSNASNATVSVVLPEIAQDSAIAMLGYVSDIFERGTQAQIMISDIKLFGDIILDDLHATLRWDEHAIRFEGLRDTESTGVYRFGDGSLDMKLSRKSPVYFDAKGTVHDNKISLFIDNASMPMVFLNPFFSLPLFLFESGIAHGNLYVEGPLSDPDYFGTLYSDKVEASLFYTPDERLSLKNPVISVSQNMATMGHTPVVANRTDGTVTKGYLALEMALEQWALPSLKVSIEIPDTPVSLWVPIVTSQLMLEGMVRGQISISTDESGQLLEGDITVESGVMSFQLPSLPDWTNIPMTASTDITITTGKNVSFAYPGVENPIVKAVFEDNQKFTLSYDFMEELLTFDGSLAFRSGEIYYIQKNFYVTEGNLNFGKQVTEKNLIDVSLDLRARLREFDENGLPVDIYIVLENSKLDAIAPRFESIPMKTTNEILELLGQGVIGGMGFDESPITSVVAIASVATDLFSRFGIIDNPAITTFGVSNIIRESLGLDVFSIRSNLLQNILFDALPGSSPTASVSPVARYLDNTTLYIGKYLLDDLYLQGMIHLRSSTQPDINTFSFLANDMEIDTELSVEWNNPLATFSIFTKPRELSVFNLLDTIGFSVTKRIVF
ncbi:MAG: translocation/assembly module TamB domain-containing protein [Sphaerochaetaceae bacterium]|nr:translocation/assembly module TamB domain-containing protein [Sphaerochaetaceae bacterium]